MSEYEMKKNITTIEAADMFGAIAKIGAKSVKEFSELILKDANIYCELDNETYNATGQLNKDITQEIIEGVRINVNFLNGVNQILDIYIKNPNRDLYSMINCAPVIPVGWTEFFNQV